MKKDALIFTSIILILFIANLVWKQVKQQPQTHNTAPEIQTVLNKQVQNDVSNIAEYDMSYSQATDKGFAASPADVARFQEPDQPATPFDTAIAALPTDGTRLDPIADMFIINNRPLFSYGEGEQLIIGNNRYQADQTGRTFLQFDLSTLRSQPITGATLHLFSVDTNGCARQTRLVAHHVHVPWSEAGHDEYTPRTNATNWIYATYPTPWNSFGASGNEDIDMAPLGFSSLQACTLGLVTIQLDPQQLTDILQDNTVLSIMIKTEDDSSWSDSYRHIASREHTDPAQRPFLTIRTKESDSLKLTELLREKQTYLDAQADFSDTRTYDLVPFTQTENGIQFHDLIFAMTEPIPGSTISSVSAGNTLCQQALGPEFSWTDFHIQKGWTALGRWENSHTAPTGRVWSWIRDQPAECFESATGNGMTGVLTPKAPIYAHVSWQRPASNAYTGDTGCTELLPLLCHAKHTVIRTDLPTIRFFEYFFQSSSQPPENPPRHIPFLEEPRPAAS